MLKKFKVNFRDIKTMEFEEGVTYKEISEYFKTYFDYDILAAKVDNNIMDLSDSVFEYRFQNEELTREVNAILGKQFLAVLPDTFELSGYRDSLYWKDIKIGKISIGYINVSKEKKKLFDKSLKTFKIR